MNNKQFENQKMYSTSLFILSKLQENRLISEVEFIEAERILNEKYKPTIVIVSLCINLI
jgi:hypothetical protein